MTQKKRGLGRGLSDLGLSELLSTINTETAVAPPDQKKLSVDLLQPGKFQPRKDIKTEALEELASSIRAQGIIQPIVVRPLANQRYEIIAGERRWRAAQMAELSEVPVVVRDISDEAAIAMSLIENIQREDLNAIEEATALQRLVDEFAMTHQEVADAVGKSRATVTNLLRLLGLSAPVKAMLAQGAIEMGHARALLAMGEAQQLKTATLIQRKGLSVRETENLIRRLQAPRLRATQHPDPDVIRLQTSLSDKLGATVLVQHNAKGRGRLIICYTSLDELDGILSHIQ